MPKQDFCAVREKARTDSLRFWGNGNRNVEVWKYGNMKVWKYESVEAWECESMRMWKYENMEILKCRGLQIRHFICNCS